MCSCAVQLPTVTLHVRTSARHAAAITHNITEVQLIQNGKCSVVTAVLIADGQQQQHSALPVELSVTVDISIMGSPCAM